MVWTRADSACPEPNPSVNCPGTAWATIGRPIRPATPRTRTRRRRSWRPRPPARRGYNSSTVSSSTEFPTDEAPAPMPRGRRPGKADTRAQIVAAAEAVFASEGYAQASLRGIAQRAGVDPALVHHYFDGK